ncbi:hypothetical protein Tco_0175277 [Tanacetum coccineum]
MVGRDVWWAVKEQEAINTNISSSNSNNIKKTFNPNNSIPADVVEKLKQQDKPQKSAKDIRKVKMEQAGKQIESQYIIKSSDKAALKEFDQKRALFETMTASKTFNKYPKHKALYHALIESILADEDAMDKDVADIKKKRKPDNADRDEDPPTELDQGSPTLHLEWNEGKTVDSKPTQNCLSGLAKAEKPSKTFDDLMSTLIDFSAFAMNRRQINDLIQDILVGPAYQILKGTCRSYVELEYNMEECYKELTDQLDWNNPEGDRYPFDLSKPLALVKSRNRQIVPVDYFFNNDLAYLQGGTTSRTYTTSLTKTKAAKYDLPKIEEMEIPTESPIENILFNLNCEDIVHPAAALRMFTRRIVIQKRVEDLQLGVESYQKKLNISKPRTHEENLSRRTPYTTLLDPQGVIYEDKLNRKRFMRSDELYKFSGGTL